MIKVDDDDNNILCTKIYHKMIINNAYALIKCINIVQNILQKIYVILEYTSIIPIFTRR